VGWHISFNLKSFKLKRLDAAPARKIQAQRKPLKKQVLPLILRLDLRIVLQRDSARDRAGRERGVAAACFFALGGRF